MSHTGFREPLWQRLHIASLTLARQALSAAVAQHGSASEAGTIGRALREPDANGYIDLTSESRDSSGRAPEELTQVGIPCQHPLEQFYMSLQYVLGHIRKTCSHHLTVLSLSVQVLRLN